MHVVAMPRPVSRTKILAVVRRIPRGRVATYGQVAALANLPGQARQVGYALHALPFGSRVPWHRVINAKGEISPRTWGESHITQRDLLEAEDVQFNASGRVSLAKHQWKPTMTRVRTT